MIFTGILRKHLRYLLVLISLNSVSVILDIVGLSSILIVFKNILSNQESVLIYGYDIKNKYLLISILSTLILRIFLSYIINIKIYAFGYTIRTTYKCVLLDVISRQSIINFNKKRVSDYLFYINDITQNATTYFLIPLIKNASELICFVVLICVIIFNTSILSVLFPVAIFIGFLMIKLLQSKVDKKIGLEQNKPWNESIKTITDAVSNFKYIKITKSISILNDYIIELNDKYCTAKIKEHKSSLLNKVYVEFTTVIVIAVLLFLLIDGNSFIINNKELILMYCFLGIRFGPIIGSILRNFTLITISYDSVVKLLNFEKDLNKGIDKPFIKTHDASEFEIICDSMNYRYNSNIVFKKNITFKIKSGDWFVIRGPSGSGKTTLSNIILNLLHTDTGVITYSTNFKNDLLHGSIGYLSQSPVIPTSYLYDVFRQNTTDTLSSKDIKQINDVLSCVLLDSKLHEISDNDFYIGENGNALSGGQLQRLALARAIYNARRFLILDEPSSALDNATRDTIFSNIKIKYPSLTVIIITHDKKLEEYGSKLLTL